MQRVSLCGHGPITAQTVRCFFGIDTFEILNITAAGVASSQKHIARRRAYGRAGVVLRPTLAFRGHAVEMRCLDLLLPVATEFGIAEIIRKNHDDVWPALHRSRLR